MPDKAVSNPSTATQARTGYLIAGVALQTPNQDPDAIPTPEAIKFLYSLPIRSIKELDSRNSACPICLDDFTTDGHNHEGDVFKMNPEIPMALPCLHVLGSHCAWKYLSPFERSQGNNCPLCRREFFTKGRLVNNPAGVGRAFRLIEWVTQECKRRLVEGPEEGKKDARNVIAYMEQQRTKIEQQNAEMQTGRVDHTIGGEARGLEAIREELQRFQDRRGVLDASLTRLTELENPHEAQVLRRLREERARLDADLERVREEETVESAAETPDTIAALRERYMRLAHDSLRAAQQENEALRDLLTRLRQDSAERERAEHR